jgi:hypothetical protein
VVNVVRLIALLAGFALALPAQEFRATISGRITDAQNAAIAAAKISVVQIGTEAKFETIAGTDGLYTIPFLPPGNYRLTAEASGFKRHVHENVSAGANERLGIDIQMEIGAVNETINVSADASVLQTTTASTGQVIASAQIENMPVSGRTPLALAQLAFGVVPNTDPRFTRPFDNAGPSGFSMGGAPAQVNELLIDGAADNTGNLRVAYNPPMDAVAEVKAESFQADAAYGHTGGGTVNVITRSGTNQFHGTLYAFNQNSAFNATPFFTNKAGARKPVSRFNQYGGSFSGPVRAPKLFDGRNKVFFMFAYEEVRDALPAPTTNTMPTPAERTGDFSALLNLGSIYTIYDPLTGVAQGGRVSRQPFPGNLVPADRISSIAKNYLQYYALPNQAGQPNGQGNFLSNTDGERNSFYNVIGRLDVSLSDRHRFFFGARNNLRTGNGGNPFGRLVNDNPTATNALKRLNWGFTFDDVYTVSPTFLINTRLNWTRFVEPQRNFSLGYDSTTLGFPAYLSAAAPRKTLPRLTFSTFTGIGDAGGIEFPFDTFQIYESLTKIYRKHSLKFGMDLRQQRESQINYGYSNGSFTFGTNWTNGPLDNSPAAPIGQDLAAFLLGMPTSGQFDLIAWRENRNHYYAFFLQDDIRVRANLTVNIGLRMEGETPTTEKYNRTLVGFDNSTPSPISAQAIAAYAANPIPEISPAQFKVNGGPLFASPGKRGIYATPKANFSPRIGFAWTPSGLGNKTVIRGGTGIYYFPYGIAGNNGPGFSQTTSMVATLDGYLTPAATLANPFPGGIQTPTGSSQGLGTFLGKAITFYDPNPGYAYSARWQLSVQRELFPGVLLEIGYQGNKALKMPVDHNFDGIPVQYLSPSLARDQTTIDRLTANVPNPFANLIPGTGLNGSVVARSQLLLADPQFTSVTGQSFTDGSSHFHAFEARLEKRFSHGFLMLVNFQKSRLMEKRSRLNDLDPALEKRTAAEDRPYRVVWSGTYDLPFGRGKAVMKDANRILNYAVGGWNVNLIYTLQPGTPLGWGNIIYLGGPLNLNPHNVDASFDTAQFNRVSAQQLSQNRRFFPTRFSNLRQDGVNQVDFSIIKAFPITEKLAMTYRCEFFNSTNRAIFNAPDLSPPSSTFGKILSQANTPRRIQMALRLVF